MSRLIIDFGETFETDSRLGMLLEGVLAEHEQIWLWDHYFALVMHQLADETVAQHLMETLAQWAGAFSTKILSPVNELHAEGALTLDAKLKIQPISGDVHECYVIEARANDGGWPEVVAKLPQQPSQRRMAYSVIALAQYFLNKNPLFFRELPLHILAMRKFYLQQMARTEAASVAEAPGFAFQTAMRFFEDMSQNT